MPLLLPTGIAKFSTIRGYEDGKKTDQVYIYADKTELLHNLLKTKSPYFLSRPRRFGKSLLVDTLDDILRGRRELFEGLQIYKSNYDWQPYPVIRLSLAAIDTESVDTVKSGLIRDLKGIAKSENLTLEGSTPSEVFKSLFEDLYSKYGREVAVLIDEYDSPILSKLHQPELAEKIRECLRFFYLVLKDKEKLRGFTFITGVTKFAQASIFSALNNLVDITLDEQYASICGFTEDEFNSLFPEYMEVMLESLKSNGAMAPEATETNLKKSIKDWYDCYTWDGHTKIFNPWSILFAFKKNLFGDYWTQTGGIASFLAGLIKNNLIDFTTFKSDQSITESLNAIELGKGLDPIPVLFQSGYLTVDRVEKSSGTAKYFLKIPNLEVRAGLIPLLLSLKPIQDPLGVWRNACSMLSSLIQLDAEGFENAFGSFLAEFPYSIHVPAEAYYHSLFQAAMFLADAKIKTEVSVGDGRYDASFTAPDGTIFVFEFKYCQASYDISQDSQATVNDYKKKLELRKKMKVKAKEAFKQIDSKNYVKKFWGDGHDLYKVAVVVGGRTEVLVEFIKEAQKVKTVGKRR